ncbi:MaoC family dehydratase [Roseivivax sp. GX 12232]|uniref:MaoC family dehydratase n=1 Tax=Roseivivax sp. GX 12232 TaxID=2900547 RepID=UPI001E54A084|nr:MaoC family dehydratase [Roseivivax sp. GX 12232]MCE0505579.1 MaoC family dehydratase [Roseivivax sp. GX 12232]
MWAESLRSLGPSASRWYEVTPDQVRAFAGASLDWQGIHLEDEAARAAGFPGPVAHGFLALSLLSTMLYDVLPELPGGAWSVNYGFDRVRFLAPIAVGTRLRGQFQMSEMRPREGGGMLLRWDVTVEREGEEKPALAADWLTLVNWTEDES